MTDMGTDLSPEEYLGVACAYLSGLNSPCRTPAEGERAAVALQADARALADVRTLDEWSVAETYRHVFLYGWGASGLPRVVLHSNNASINEEVFRGATLDEARAKAAAWVRGLK